MPRLGGGMPGLGGGKSRVLRLVGGRRGRYSQLRFRFARTAFIGDAALFILLEDACERPELPEPPDYVPCSSDSLST